MLGKRLMIDTSKCQACKACQAACKQWHSLEAEDTTFTGSYQNPPDMSGTNLTVVKFTEIEGADGKVKWLFFKDGCRHCDNPMCKGACPLKAIKRQANGFVRIDPDICDPSVCGTGPGKRPCQISCPFQDASGLGIIRRVYKKDGVPVYTKARKCDFCYNRQNKLPEALELKSGPFVSTDGKTKSALPACQVTCPPGAITSGAADGIMKKAIQRVNKLKANGYPNANVYPSPVGIGTHVIWVLLEAPAAYGLKSA